ncbi:16S rRNA (adenine(1518)-N(6)/adenine(1519)-N(6))-dimethyltransferase [[Mycoplasma] cavipharyngis]|uniref:16S rRNA (adenine(1518)-N(6)/adenine(1519)-N(6))- dimethyltransferase RsmA n=1 Tax=[Mycoplasma] cavipharyngis TaxID=92757 RepID=UPI003703A681
MTINQKLLNELKVNPSKKLGQNFLVNNKIAKQIAQLVNASNYQQIVEIGPGLGAITKQLDLSKKQYWGIELDYRLFSYLLKLFTNNEKVSLINLDFLKFNSQDYFEQEGLLFGNIPYSISTKIIKHFLADTNLNEAILMVQKEYYQRLSAQVNTKDYNSLSVYVQTFCDLELLITVSANNFHPIPKVDSVVFQLKKKTNCLVAKQALFGSFVKTCFQMKRKTLVNNIKPLFRTKEQMLVYLKQLKIDPNCRAETLDLLTFQQMFLTYDQNYHQYQRKKISKR